MNMWLMIISIILTNAFSVCEASNNPSNIQLILCINIIGNVAIFAIYWINIQLAVKETLGILDKLKNSTKTLKPLEQIFVSKGMTKEAAMHFEEIFGEDGWSEEVKSPKTGDLYFALSEYKKDEKDMIGATPVMFNESDKNWYALNKKTYKLIVLENIICFKSFDTLPEEMQEKFKKGIEDGKKKI